MQRVAILLLVCALTFSFAHGFGLLYGDSVRGAALEDVIEKRHHEPGHHGDDDTSDDDDDDSHSHDDDDLFGSLINAAAKRQLDSDNDAESNSESEDEEECEDLVFPCFIELSPYMRASQTAEVLNDQSLAEQCEAAISIRDCFRNALESRSCSAKIDDDDKEVLQLLSFMGGVIKFVCEDHQKEFQDHEECFREAKLDQAVESCRIDNLNGTRCQPEKFIECTDAAITATPRCEKGAKELIAAFVRDMFTYIPDCRVPGMKLLKKLRMKRMK